MQNLQGATRLVAALFVLVALLATGGCSGAAPGMTAQPLAADRPSFLFFYTDN